MRKQILQFVGALSVAACTVSAHAALLDMTNPGGGSNPPVPQTFGDTSAVDFSWDARMKYWNGGYSGQDTFYCEDAGTRGSGCLFQLETLTGTPLVTLDYFTLGSWGGAQRNIVWSVFDLATSLLVLNGTATPNGTPAQVNVNKTSADGFKVLFGPDGWEGGLLNVAYSLPTKGVPEPASLALLGAAFLGIAAARRRR